MTRGWTTAAVDLPTVHAPDKAALGMAADADAVRAAIDAIDGDVVVIAHSYGGVPTTQGADAGNVTHIVYVSAFVLDIGESLFAATGGVQPDWWNVKDGLATAGTGAPRAGPVLRGSAGGRGGRRRGTAHHAERAPTMTRSPRLPGAAARPPT